MIRHLETEPTRPARVVVLGATGFVGRGITRHLNESQIETLPLSSEEIDLTKPEAVEKLRGTVVENDSLVIVSAITPDKGKDAATLMRNLSMGQHVSDFLESAKCSHVVYISSD